MSMTDDIADDNANAEERAQRKPGPEDPNQGNVDREHPDELDPKEMREDSREQ